MDIAMDINMVTIMDISMDIAMDIIMDTIMAIVMDIAISSLAVAAVVISILLADLNLEKLKWTVTLLTDHIVFVSNKMIEGKMLNNKAIRIQICVLEF